MTSTPSFAIFLLQKEQEAAFFNGARFILIQYPERVDR
jgi:hypothetical protein